MTLEVNVLLDIKDSDEKVVIEGIKCDFNSLEDGEMFIVELPRGFVDGDKLINGFTIVLKESSEIIYKRKFLNSTLLTDPNMTLCLTCTITFERK